MNSKKMANLAIAGLLTTALGSISTQALAAKAGMEKCHGVAKAAKNDCGSASHSCAGQSTKDGHGKDWIYLPKGTCDKIVGGSVEAKDDNGTKS